MVPLLLWQRQDEKLSPSSPTSKGLLRPQIRLVVEFIILVENTGAAGGPAFNGVIQRLCWLQM